MDLVLYDETEYFREFNNPLFDYPYQRQKNIISTNSVILGRQKTDYSLIRLGDYPIVQHRIKLMKSVTCLEDHFTDKLFLNEQFQKDITNIKMFQAREQNHEEISDEQKCENLFFEKMKYSKSQVGQKMYSEIYPESYKYDDGKERVIMMIQITQDNIKQINTRQTSGILDFLGDVGGFYSFISVFGIISNFISQKLLVAKLGEKMYLKQEKPKKKSKKRKNTKEDPPP